jgi:hypothetical protein
LHEPIAKSADAIIEQYRMLHDLTLSPRCIPFMIGEIPITLKPLN